MTGGGWAVVAALMALLGVTGWFAWRGWTSLEGVEMSTNGMIAMALGGGFTILLSVFLMWLVYFSHRHGYDDEAGKD
jgi:hypothetical protein